MYNLNRIIYFFLYVMIFALPLISYYSYNTVSKLTYQKKYYLVKENSPEFIKNVNLQDSPIINENSIKEFIEDSVLKIFNYRTATALNNLSELRFLFDNQGYSDFSNNYTYRIELERAAGVVINDALFIKSPLYMGYYNYGDEISRVYYFELKELKTGENQSEKYNTVKVFIEIVLEDFEKNKKGLSIKSIILN